MADVIFPNIGISFQTINRVAFTIFGHDIYWYAIFVVTGIIAGYYFGAHFAPKKTGQDVKLYTDFALWVVPLCILGGRIFYIIFDPWPQGAGFLHIFNIRSGGIAIWGVIITGVLVAFIYARLKKISFWNFADTAIVGLIIGHVIGRFGNFTNREAFGGYASDSAPFAMQIRLDQVLSMQTVTPEMLDNQIVQSGLTYIQVHPVFFYEAAINLALFVFLNLYRKHKKFNGELIAFYFISYGVTRFFLESMRTDQLLIGSSNIAVAHLLSAAAALFGLGFLVCGYINCKKSPKKSA